jgi:ABC-type cobalamin transport system permease subunit
VVVGRVVVVAVAIAGIVADIGVFVLFVSRGFYTRDSRSLIALKDWS